MKQVISTKNGSPKTRKRIYWRTSDGIEHGFVKKENGSSLEVYSYERGTTVQVSQKEIAKVITEEL